MVRFSCFKRQDRPPVQKQDKALLYGLYKQATKGDAPAGKMSFGKKSKSKIQAWNDLQDIPEETLEEAFRHINSALELLKDEGTKKDEKPPTASSSTMIGDSSELRASDKKDSSSPEDPTQSSTTGSDTADESVVSPEDTLLTAAGENDVKTTRELLDKGVSIDHTDECGQTALHMAADHGAQDTLKLLLEKGASVASSDQYGVSVLQAAVIAGHVHIAKILLENGADPDQTDEDGDSPKMCALDDGSPEMQELFDDDDEEEEEEEGDDHFEQESTISWDTEFTIEKIRSPHKIIDRIPSILDK